MNSLKTEALNTYAACIRLGQENYVLNVSNSHHYSENVLGILRSAGDVGSTSMALPVGHKSIASVVVIKQEWCPSETATAEELIDRLRDQLQD